MAKLKLAKLKLAGLTMAGLKRRRRVSAQVCLGCGEPVATVPMIGKAMVRRRGRDAARCKTRLNTRGRIHAAEYPWGNATNPPSVPSAMALRFGASA
jgi:hypothetical protein